MLNHDWTKATASGPNGNCLEARWRKAESSNGNGGSNCVEARWADGVVQVRDSKDSDGPALTFTPAEWTAFLDGAGKGEFALPDGVTA